MKLHYYLCLLVGLLISSATFADGNIPGFKGGFISGLTEDYPLYLKGEFQQTGGRSVQPEFPMEAAISENILYIEFSSAVGEVTISINGNGQQTYTSKVNVEAAWHLISIPLNNYKPGIYKLEFKNSKGDYVFGEFAVE